MNEHLELESLARALANELDRRGRHGIKHVEAVTQTPSQARLAKGQERQALPPPKVSKSTIPAATSIPAVPKPTHLRPTGRQSPTDIPGLRRKLSQCIDCSLSAGPRQSGALVGRGAARPVLAFVTDFAGPAERRYGKALAPDAGQMIANMTTKGFHLKLDQIYLTAAVKCPLGQGCRPNPKQTKACAQHLSTELEMLQPGAIIAFGALAAAALGWPKTEDFATLRGRLHQYMGRTPLVITAHPRDMLADPSLKAAVWQDLQQLRPHLKDS